MEPMYLMVVFIYLMFLYFLELLMKNFGIQVLRKNERFKHSYSLNAQGNSSSIVVTPMLSIIILVFGSQ